MEYPDKKVLLPLALAALLVIALGLYIVLRNSAAPFPVAEQPPETPVVQQPMTQENKMQILQGLATEKIPVVERKNILRMLMR